MCPGALYWRGSKQRSNPIQAVAAPVQDRSPGTHTKTSCGVREVLSYSAIVLQGAEALRLPAPDIGGVAGVVLTARALVYSDTTVEGAKF